MSHMLTLAGGEMRREESLSSESNWFSMAIVMRRRRAVLVGHRRAIVDARLDRHQCPTVRDACRQARLLDGGAPALSSSSGSLSVDLASGFGDHVGEERPMKKLKLKPRRGKRVEDLVDACQWRLKSGAI